MENKQTPNGITGLGNHSTDLLATLYIVIVFGVLAILTLIKEITEIGTGKEPAGAVTAIKYVKLASDGLKGICAKVAA